jgi:hypothetical protein
MVRGSIIVRADWDPEAAVWVATSGDVDGLAIEADTLEALGPKVVSAVTDLLAMNGWPEGRPEIPVHILAEQVARVSDPRR